MLKSILKNKVVKNFSYLTIGSAFSQLLSLLTIIKITRALSPGDYGVYTFIMMQGTLILVLGDLGVRNIVIRSIARDPHRTNDLVFNGAVLRSSAILVLSLLYILYNYHFGSLTSKQLLFIFIFSLITCFSSLFEYVYLGYQKMLYLAAINLGYSILWFITIYALPAKFITVASLFYVFLFLNAVKAIFFFAFLKYRRLLAGNIKNFFKSSKNLLKESWPYFAFVLITLPFTKLPNNFLDINSTTQEVGYFNLANKLLGPVSMVLSFVWAALFPNLASIWAKDKEQLREIISEGIKYFMLVCSVLCFLFTLFARDVVTLLFPEEYLPAVKVCQLHVWYLFLESIGRFMGVVFGATNKERVLLKLGLIHSLFAIPVLYYSSKVGALGLSYGFIITLGLFQFYLWYVFRKTLKVKITHSGLLWVVAVVLFLISYFLMPLNNTFFYRVLLALGVLTGVTIYFSKTYTSVVLIK